MSRDLRTGVPKSARSHFWPRIVYLPIPLLLSYDDDYGWVAGCNKAATGKQLRVMNAAARVVSGIWIYNSGLRQLRQISDEKCNEFGPKLISFSPKFITLFVTVHFLGV